MNLYLPGWKREDETRTMQERGMWRGRVGLVSRDLGTGIIRCWRGCGREVGGGGSAIRQIEAERNSVIPACRETASHC